MPVPNVLFVSHPQKQCGVHQFGSNVVEALQRSTKYQFVYRECDGAGALLAAMDELRPVAVIYNHHGFSMPWLTGRVTRKIKVPQLGILHEVTQAVADRANHHVFDYHIAPDPSLLLNNPIVFKTGRLLPVYANPRPEPAVVTVGSFGFGTAGKGFEQVITRVQDEYDQAIIRLHIPFAVFGDTDGQGAIATVKRCRELITKPGIELFASHDFLSPPQLLDFLAANTINAFFYEPNDGRGISSVIDHALAVNRPIAVSRSNMFRHVLGARPSICIEDASLHQIIANGTAPLRPFQEEWTATNLVWDYERIIAQVLARPTPPVRLRGWHGNLLVRAARKVVRTLRNRPEPGGFQGAASGDKQMRPGAGIEAAAPRPAAPLTYTAQTLSAEPLNRILDDAARDHYAPAIEALFQLAPDLMARKIARANVQQAFVLDTVLKFAVRQPAPKMLCVGGYEDSAAASLKALGLRFEDIDPALSYDLHTFLTKPSTVPASYDIVFSTSVIEHVEDDARFVREIADLLAPGGVAILTCDYNDQYRPGERIPAEDFRFYTQRDLRERLLGPLRDCALADAPQWDCPAPDFSYAGCSYTFATLVFQKKPL